LRALYPQILVRFCILRWACLCLEFRTIEQWQGGWGFKPNFIMWHSWTKRVHKIKQVILIFVYDFNILEGFLSLTWNVISFGKKKGFYLFIYLLVHQPIYLKVGYIAGWHIWITPSFLSFLLSFRYLFLLLLLLLLLFKKMMHECYALLINRHFLINVIWHTSLCFSSIPKNKELKCSTTQ
jgi:hypothetical protein